MVVHLVCFKYKQDVEEGSRAAHRERLRGLTALDGVLDLKVGEDFVRAERSYDTGLMVLLRDRAALESYRVDPQARPGRTIRGRPVRVDRVGRLRGLMS